jgi:membrane protease YdiL (CAAX protease family)
MKKSRAKRGRSPVPEWLRYKREFDRHETNYLLVCFAIPAILTMSYIYWLPTAGEWKIFALYMLTFASTGFAGYLLLDFRAKGSFSLKPVDANSGVRGFIILMVLMLLQLAFGLGKQLSLTNVEKALYFVFAAVSEEFFLRGLLLRGALAVKNHVAVAVVVTAVSTVLFDLIHANYYDNLTAMSIVTVSGVFLCVMFVLWKDLTANIIAHLVINIIFALQLYVFV